MALIKWPLHIIGIVALEIDDHFLTFLSFFFFFFSTVLNSDASFCTSSSASCITSRFFFGRSPVS